MQNEQKTQELKLLLKNVTFNNYTGGNTSIKKWLGENFDVYQNNHKCLILIKDGIQIIKTTPVTDKNAYRAFELQVHEYATKNSGYSFVENKSDRYSGLF